MKKSVTYEDRALFSGFYNKLEPKKDIFFLYCTTNLLHYVLGNVGFHKKIVNLVLITGGLSAEEREFISNTIKIPVCHLERAYIDFYIWDLLIETCKENFGWLDIDCFIRSKSVLEDICDIAPETFFQAVWERKYSFYQYRGILSSTYLVFINISVAREIWKECPQSSMIPVVFSDNIEDFAFEEYRKLEEEEIERLKTVYPQIAENKIGLDTTHYYQLLAVSRGYQIKMVRGLKNNDFSEEIIHLGGAHRMEKYSLGVNRHRFYDKFNMRFSFYLLKQFSNILPIQYMDLLDRYKTNLVRNKINPDFDDIKMKIKSFVQLNGIVLPILD